MRIVNIIALPLILILFIVTAYFMGEVSSARWASWGFGYDSYGYYGPDADDLTIEAGVTMLLFILFFTFAYIGNLVKVKTPAAKVLSIIGLSFTLIVLLIDFLTMGDPGGVSFDESGAFFFIYGIINLAFFIVLLVQAVKFAKRGALNKANSTVLDEQIV